MTEVAVEYQHEAHNRARVAPHYPGCLAALPEV